MLLALGGEDFQELGITNKFHLKNLIIQKEKLSTQSPQQSVSPEVKNLPVQENPSFSSSQPSFSSSQPTAQQSSFQQLPSYQQLEFAYQQQFQSFPQQQQIQPSSQPFSQPYSKSSSTSLLMGTKPAIIPPPTEKIQTQPKMGVQLSPQEWKLSPPSTHRRSNCI